MDAAGYSIAFSSLDGVLRAHVGGMSSLDVTVAYWLEIARETRERGTRLLLLVDELEGEPLGEADWLHLVTSLRNAGLQKLRIAHVKPGGLQEIEFCEIFARDAGIEARVFDNETLADIWLRYGER